MSAIVAHLAALPRSRVVIAAIAFLVTLIGVTGFLLESRWGYSGRVVPVVFVKSWPATRSDADIDRERAAEVAAARADAAASRAYIATLHGGAKVAAQNQYDAYLAAQPKSLQPPGFAPHAPPK